MDAWRLLNQVRQSLYLDDSHQGSEKDLHRLITLASKSDDTELIKSVLIIKEDSDKPSPKKRLLWLTSRLRDHIYPPLPIDIAGPLIWNDGLTIFNSNAKYCYERPLKPNEGVMGPSQCRHLEDCSFVASLISMKAGNVFMPVIRQLNEYRYHVNLCFNGSRQRLVSVDVSKVPTSASGDQLSLTSDKIIDKVMEMAYLQVTSGSYSTTGSNTAIDTFLLTGYIPEVCSVSNVLSLQELQELIEFFKTGKCLLALGTGQRQRLGPDDPLMRNHDYPVIGVDSQCGLMVLRDPLDPSLRLQTDLEVLIKNYEQMYINWHTDRIFAFERTLEFFYNVAKCNEFDTAMDKPLFLLENGSESEQDTWLLLESHLKSERKESIAYLRELPDRNALSPVGAPYEGACNIGLQLLKLRMKPNSTKKIFCHSSISNAFTIHLYSNSASMHITRWDVSRICKTLECKTNDLEKCYIGSSFYYKSPTFELEIVHPEDKEVSLNLQLVSEERREMVNIQIYYLNDHSLQKPILADPTYTQQRYDKFFLPLSANVPYKLVCSSYGNSAKPLTYKLQVMPSDDQSLLPHIKVKQIYTQFGGLPFQIKRELPCSGPQTQVLFTMSTNTTCFIRVVPSVLSSLAKIRLTICDTIGTVLHDTESCQPPPPGGMVIYNWKSIGPAKYILIIHVTGLGADFNSYHLTVMVGSSKKIIIDERFAEESSKLIDQ